MNTIEKRKKQLNGLGITGIIIGLIAVAGGAVMLAFSTKNFAFLAGGITLLVLGVVGVILGIVLCWLSRAVVATKGSIAEENLGIGTVNMHKCTNCGAEISEDRTICEKCEENLKP